MNILRFCILALFPATMLIFGRAMAKCPPKEINSLLGYRTRRSMSSKEAWAYANKCCGKYWVVCGFVTLPLAVAAFFLFLRQAFFDTILVIFIFIQLAVLLSAIPATEISLKKQGY